MLFHDLVIECGEVVRGGLPSNYCLTRNQGEEAMRDRWIVERLEVRALLTVLAGGFAEATVASGLSRPTAMEFAPDGRIRRRTGRGRSADQERRAAADAGPLRQHRQCRR